MYTWPDIAISLMLYTQTHLDVTLVYSRIILNHPDGYILHVPYEIVRPDLRWNPGDSVRRNPHSIIKMLSCIRRIKGGVRAVYGSKYLNEIRSIPCLKSPSMDALHILGGIRLINKTKSVLSQHGFLLKLTWIPSNIQKKSIQ